jgi:hypothetical protein
LKVLEFIEWILGKLLKVLLTVLYTFVAAFGVVFVVALAYGAFKEIGKLL